MSWFSRNVTNIPAPMSPRVAKIFIVLSLFTLALGFSAIFFYEGATRLFYVISFSAMSIANLLWSIGSLQRDPQRSLQMRAAMRPFAFLMLATLPVAAWLVLFGQ
ncbi:MAG: hypothetical protein U0Z70_22460 [Thermomicrobiales bacterium]